MRHRGAGALAHTAGAAIRGGVRPTAGEEAAELRGVGAGGQGEAEVAVTGDDDQVVLLRRGFQARHAAAVCEGHLCDDVAQLSRALRRLPYAALEVHRDGANGRLRDFKAHADRALVAELARHASGAPACGHARDIAGEAPGHEHGDVEAHHPDAADSHIGLAELRSQGVGGFRLETSMAGGVARALHDDVGGGQLHHLLEGEDEDVHRRSPAPTLRGRRADGAPDQAAQILVGRPRRPPGEVPAGNRHSQAPTRLPPDVRSPGCARKAVLPQEEVQSRLPCAVFEGRAVALHRPPTLLQYRERGVAALPERAAERGGGARVLQRQGVAEVCPHLAYEGQQRRSGARSLPVTEVAEQVTEHAGAGGRAACSGARRAAPPEQVLQLRALRS
mmetsp:Transcript_86087/g.248568  ORF Transcript_86087/g.248568 Transcript_86087/m.248568 type:complete len:390 (-) Transcript_86087:1392-2561(-)